MRISLESPIDRAISPIVAGLLLVGVTVLCSAAVGTILIGAESDLEGETEPNATIETSTVVRDETNGFVTLEVTSMTRAERVEIMATTDGASTIIDGSPNGTAERIDHVDAMGDTVTVRKAVDSAMPRDVDVRIVAVAQYNDAETRVFDRTVTL
ncbi:type IV pilin [Natronorubrum sp. DTA28]|uniref:type IV pilin n=1 Tax=Natronorubrum sp. DTA28 TaxID=3447019 RepID=UPI003F833880